MSSLVTDHALGKGKEGLQRGAGPVLVSPTVVMITGLSICTRAGSKTEKGEGWTCSGPTCLFGCGNCNCYRDHDHGHRCILEDMLDLDRHALSRCHTEKVPAPDSIPKSKTSKVFAPASQFSRNITSRTPLGKADKFRSAPQTTNPG